MLELLGLELDAEHGLRFNACRVLTEPYRNSTNPSLHIPRVVEERRQGPSNYGQFAVDTSYEACRQDPGSRGENDNSSKVFSTN